MKATRTYYVSPRGSDGWSGTMPEAVADGSDGPFASIPRALRAARAVDRQVADAISVVLRDGSYFLERPLRLEGADSGTARCPVSFSAWPGERPVISAGVAIRGWRETTHRGARAWVAPAPGHVFHNLWVNGERRFRPRYPRAGLLRTAGKSPGGFHDGTSEFALAPADIPELSRPEEVDFVYFAVWTESHLPIRSIDRERGVLHTKLRSAMNACDVKESSRYYYDNVVEELDTPGQWYLDRIAGAVVYLPKEDERIGETEIVAPRLVHALEVAGTQEQPVSNVSFRGLTFGHTEWRRTDTTEIFRWDIRELAPPCDVRVVTKADDKAADHQAAISCEAALDFVWARDCSLEACTVADTGSYGISFGIGCTHNRVARCLIAGHGGGGIKIGTQQVQSGPAAAGFTEVEDCEIRDCAEVFHSAVGIWIGHAAHNRIAHNSIHDTSYSGLSVGWVWGYGPSGAFDNLIEHNEIYNIAVNGWMHDLAGIYMLGVSPGTIVRYNHVHHVGNGNNVIGIYTDAGSSHIRWECNLVDRADSTYLHSVGKNNVIVNNVFARYNHGLVRSRDESPDLSFVVERNVFWSGEQEILLDWQGREGYAFSRNLYWCTGGEVLFNKQAFAAWEALGHDRGSLVADPLFLDPEHGDFRLAPGSPAPRLGFVPFSVADAGPRRPPGAAKP